MFMHAYRTQILLCYITHRAHIYACVTVLYTWCNVGERLDNFELATRFYAKVDTTGNTDVSLDKTHFGKMSATLSRIPHNGMVCTPALL